MMRFHHLALEVNDLALSQEFYEKLLGFSNPRRIYFEREEMVFLERDGFRLELFHGKSGSEVTNRTHFCFEVQNLEEIMKKMHERGLNPFEGPYTLENGWKTAFYLGPDNEVIEFLECTW